MEITHSVYMANVSCTLNLEYIAQHTWNVVLTKYPFHVLRWKHRKIGGMCMMYKSGKIIHHGSKDQLRKYIRLIQKMGMRVKLRRIILVTMSGVAYLSKPNFEKLVHTLDATYEPELFHGCILKHNGMSFTIYDSGKMVITGIKSSDDVLASLIEIAWLQ